MTITILHDCCKELISENLILRSLFNVIYSTCRCASFYIATFTFTHVYVRLLSITLGVLITQLYDSSGCSNEYEDDDESSLSSSYTSDVGLYSTHYQFLDDNVDYDTDLDITEGRKQLDS